MAWLKSLGIIVGFLAVAGAIAALVLISPPWVFFGMLALLTLGYVRYNLYEDE